MLLLVDNYDSFTYNLLDYFQQLGEICHVVKNDTDPRRIDFNKFDKIVLSPGPGTPENAGFLMDYIKLAAAEKPILGICLGHQAIAQYYGGEIIKAKMPMHGKISICNKLDSDELVIDMPTKWSVVRYHSLIATWNNTIPLKSIAETDEGENMILRHKYFPIFGIQYHPEAYLTEYGIDILRNWLKAINKSFANKCI